jgi:4-amino-4-deoxy-L-arabinose transferase-like glycosyltransferase
VTPNRPLKPDSPLRHAALPALLLLAFFLRVYGLNSQALRGDEAATVLYAALPVSQLWELSRLTDPHPPLYYLLLHPWQWLAGESAWAMRYAGVLAAVLAVAALHGLARLTRQSRPVSLLAAGLLAVNPLQIWLAQDIRSYPFFTLLGLLSSAALWQALGQNSNRKWQSAKCKWQIAQFTIHHSSFKIHHSKFFPWVVYVALTTACLYIHYYTVFLIAFQGVFVLAHAQKFWPQRRVWLISQAAIALLITPGLQLAYNFVGEAAGGIDTIPTPEILRRASTALLTGFTLSDAWGLWISLAMLPVWLAGLYFLWRQNRLTGAFWALFFAAPVLGVIALSVGRPFFKERFLIQAQPAFELLLAAGLVGLAQWGNRVGADLYVCPAGRTRRFAPTRIGLPLAALLLAVLLIITNAHALTNYHTNPAYAKAPPWHLYHAYVSQKARPGDVMLTNFPEAAISYYSPNTLPFYVVPAERDQSTQFRQEQTAQIAGAYRRIWFLPMLQQGFDEQGDVLTWLDRHADRVNQIFFPVYNLNLYLSPPALEEAMIRQPAAFAHGIRLRGFQIFDKEGRTRLDMKADPPRLVIKPEQEFTLSLYWQADAPTAQPYTVFTHLIAADGFNRTGRDNQPVWGSYPTTLWQPGERITDKYTLTIPAGSPPGDHRLRLGWYQSDTQAATPVLDKNGQPAADFMILDAVIQVE